MARKICRRGKRLYSETFPNARFQVVEEAGHFSFMEQPDLFAKTVSEFLADSD